MKNTSKLTWLISFCLGILSYCDINAQTVLDNEDFESGSFTGTIWNDAGSDCKMDSGSRLSGTYSANLEDHSASSNMYSDNLDLSGYDSVTITFDFETDDDVQSGDDLYIEFSDDGGINWHSTPILHYVEGSDFDDETTYTNVSATAVNGSPYNFTANSSFRFRVDINDSSGDLYIDNVMISYTIAIDTDGDGISDSADVDDDNDGLLDCIEKGIVYGTISEVFDLSGTTTEISNTEFELTEAKNNEAGAATIKDQINFDYSFSFSFEAYLGSKDSGADGIAMVFHNDPAGSSAVGLDGEGLGASGIQDGIVLELDTYDNGSTRGDLSVDHGMIWDSDNQSGVGLLTSAVNLGQLEDGNWHTVTMNWDASSETINYYVDSILAGTFTGDLIDDYFGGSNLVYFGFSASTGALNNVQRIRFNSVCDIPIFIDTDNDGLPNELDIDSDADGIPDNIEVQTTLGYLLPSGTVNASGTYIGLWNNYGTGLTAVDTDGDGTPDYIDTNSDNDSYTDIQENGMADTYTAADVDSDGLNNAFETTGVNDAVWDVNEDIEDPTDLSILPDADGDLASGGDLDYRDLFDTNPPSIATIDFDGVDDYLDSDLDISGYNQATIMAWIKLDPSFTTSSHIIEFGNLYIQAHSSRQIWVQVNNALVTSSSISKNVWTHVALIFDNSASSGKLKAYINGVAFGSSDDASLASSINSTSYKFNIGRRQLANDRFFKGCIDEVRVFDVALTEDQLQKMIYQEIGESSGDVSGDVVPKAIADVDTETEVSWGSLQAYYPMTDIVNNYTTDYSDNSHKACLHNISSVMAQTAPMPYTTTSSGSWTSASTWSHGDVWDIENTTNEYGIVKISNNVTVGKDVKKLGLIIDSSSALTVQGDYVVENDWYLELNGTLDLENDAQLVQTVNSDLVTSADGKVKRRQEGASSAFWYNYWASPVGAQGATSLTDNNTAANNDNNSAFSLNMLKDGSGFDMQFTSGYTASGNLSTYWLYTFINGKTYWDWAQISTSTGLSPGIGYTQKGTGVGGSEQQYIFEGKPNNGTILVAVEDVGGPGSVTNVSKTEFLLGNPYPSALDVGQFIDDNAGVISGTLHLWQQWSGSSHNLNDYNGGYAQLTKLGAVRAKQFVGFHGETTGGEVGTSIPSKYLPVGQGFITEIVADGNVEFNNGQRVFIKEADANGSFEDGSVFMKSGGKKSKQSTSKTENAADNENEFKKIRLEFNTIVGPKTRKELLVGFSKTTSDAFDYGYDAETGDINNNDINLNLEGKNMNIAAYGELTDTKVVPLNFRSSGENTFEIKISDLENIDEDQEIYLRDNLTGEYFDLTTNQPYRFTSDQGKFNTRLELVFRSEAATLSNDEFIAEENYIYHNRQNNLLYAKKMNGEVTKFTLYNIRGQSVLELSKVASSQLQNGLQLPSVATGTYVACFRVDNQQVVTKKIVIN